MFFLKKGWNTNEDTSWPLNPHGWSHIFIHFDLLCWQKGIYYICLAAATINLHLKVYYCIVIFNCNISNTKANSNILKKEHSVVLLENLKRAKRKMKWLISTIILFQLKEIILSTIDEIIYWEFMVSRKVLGNI